MIMLTVGPKPSHYQQVIAINVGEMVMGGELGPSHGPLLLDTFENHPKLSTPATIVYLEHSLGGHHCQYLDI